MPQAKVTRLTVDIPEPVVRRLQALLIREEGITLQTMIERYVGSMYSHVCVNKDDADAEQVPEEETPRNPVGYL